MNNDRRGDNRSRSSGNASRSSASSGQQRSSSSSSSGNGTRKRLVAWTVEPARKEGAKPFWHVIGSAFENKDRSLTLRLFALPLDGVVILREPRERDEHDQREPGYDD